MRLYQFVRFCFGAIALTGCAVAQTTHPRVAMVFDDGPYVSQVDGFLSLLAREQVRVTFSQVGQNVDAHPELCRAVATAGHEIFNHSYTHPHFDTITDAAIQNEITRTQAAVLAATGRVPRWFWLPYSGWDSRIAADVSAAGMQHFPVELFNLVATDDWRPETTVEQIYQRSTTGIVDRMLICGHEWPVNTYAALPAIITELKRQGCVFVTASELWALSVSPEASTNQTVAAGHDVTLTAPGATGALQWRVSSDFGRTWPNLTEGGNYHGVTSNALTITGAMPAMDALLYLIAATANGATTYPSLVKLAVVSESLPYPTAIAVDAQVGLFIADGFDHTIDRISTASVISVFAGTAGQTGSTDASGTAARFNDPQGLVVIAGGGILVADTGNARIRSITSDGVVATQTASTFAAPAGIARDSLGNFYVADGTDHTIRKITGAGAVSILAGAVGVPGNNDGAGTAAHFNHPSGVAVDGNDTVYVSDTGNNLIRKITPAGDVTTWVGASALLSHPGGLTVDGGGNVYLADTGNSVIRRITPEGGVSTLAGVLGVVGLKDGVGNEAWFNQPRGVCLDAQGTLYVADTGNAIVRRIDLGGKVTTMSLAPLTWVAAPVTPAPPVTPPTTPPSSSSSDGGGGGASSIWFLITLLSAWLVRRGLPRGNSRTV